MRHPLWHETKAVQATAERWNLRSPMRQRWENRWERKRAAERRHLDIGYVAAQPTSFPHVPLVAFHSVLLQELPNLVLIRHPAMMFLLVADIPNDSVHRRTTHAE